jgi:hypothetical protein
MGNEENGGAPRPNRRNVVAIASLTVAVLGLAWAVYTDTPDKGPPPPAPGQAVTVQGTGNVGVGTMSGGSISVGIDSKEPASSPRK